MSLVTSAGNFVKVGRKLKEGGEGVVYVCENAPNVLVKIYHKPPAPQKVQKLNLLSQLASPDLTSIAAWPTQLLYDERRRTSVVGLLMPYLHGREIHTLYSPHDRKTTFPSATWEFLVHVAKNVAAAFDTLHSKGIVMGDVNEGNFLVSQSGMVGLIDCDSYQLPSRNGHQFLCDVGIALWTPPELQGKSFTGLVREPQHDAFGLSLLIFYLLFMGRHPFAGIPKRGQDISIEEAIKQRIFAYSIKSPHPDFKAPATGFSLEKVPDEVAALFERAFLFAPGRGVSRPSAREWFNALASLQKQLASCELDKGHRYYSKLTACPWCAIRQIGGPNFFISVGTETTFILNLERCRFLYDQIKRAQPIASSLPESMTFPHLRPRVVAPTFSPLPPKPVRPALRVKALACCLLGFALQVCSLVFLLPDFVMLLAGEFVLGFAMLAIGARQLEGSSEERQKYRAAKRIFDEAEAQQDLIREQVGAQVFELQEEVRLLDLKFQEERKNFDGAHEVYRANLQRIKTGSETAYKNAMNLQPLYARDWQEIESKKMQHQMSKHLDRFLIKHASIQGVGENKKATLAAYGIESADDITANIQVPGFGAVLIGRLLAWKQGCAARFTYQPNEANDPQDVRAFSIKFKNLQQSIEADLFSKTKEIETLHDFNCRKSGMIQRSWRENLERKAQALLDIQTLNAALQAPENLSSN